MASAFLLCVLAVIFVSLGPVTVQCRCPDEWIVYGESCYALIKEHEDWVRANDVCRILGGYLAEVTDADENDFVKRYVRNNNVGDVWIGGNDLLSEGKWMWATTEERISYTDWAPSEPDNLSGANCMYLWKAQNYAWDDQPCSLTFSFLCETSSEGLGIIG